jgi:Tol biopolymer transport system component
MNRICRFQITVLTVLLVAAVLPVQATFPGRNGRIAFLLGPDIYTMKADGTDVKQLTHMGQGRAASFESWSPDGRQIVFNEGPAPPDGDGTGELWLMNADGSNQHLVLAEPDFAEIRPSFTPDGGSVIFSRCPTDVDGTCALYQITINGSGLQSITPFDLGIQDLAPRYSPDGSLAFTGTGRRGISCALYVQTVLDTGLRRLTPALLTARQPDWSPDGREIAFSSHFGTPQNKEIWVTNVETNSFRRLTHSGNDFFNDPQDFHPSWSPQGDAIVFERDVPDPPSSGIFLIKADGSGCRRLVALPSASRATVSHNSKLRALGTQSANRNVKQIETGGAMPRWGAATN